MTHKITPNFLQMVENASPINPPIGHIGIYFKTDGLAYQRDSDGNETRLGKVQYTLDQFGQEAGIFADKLVVPLKSVRSLSANVAAGDWQFNPQGGRRTCAIFTPMTSVPFYSPTGLAYPSPPGVGTPVISIQTDMVYGSWPTAAVIGSSAGIAFVSGSEVCDIRDNPMLTWRIRTGAAITTCRIWIGLFRANPNNADTLTSQGVGFRFNAVGGWTPCAFDGVTQSTGTTIGTVAINTAYLLRIRVQGTSAFFSVDDGVEQEVSANLPASGRLMPIALIYATAAAARSLLISRMMTESD